MYVAIILSKCQLSCLWLVEVRSTVSNTPVWQFEPKTMSINECAKTEVFVRASEVRGWLDGLYALVDAAAAAQLPAVLLLVSSLLK